jgi:D-arabinose 5-phosphate isomerase GutQ
MHPQDLFHENHGAMTPHDFSILPSITGEGAKVIRGNISYLEEREKSH